MGFDVQPYWIGPIIAFAVVGGLALVLRWTFGTQRFFGHRPAPASNDFGLLRAVATVDSAGAANALRAVLSDASIRATTAPTVDGRVAVLVFPADLERARRVAGPGASS